MENLAQNLGLYEAFPISPKIPQIHNIFHFFENILLVDETHRGVQHGHLPIFDWNLLKYLYYKIGC